MSKAQRIFLCVIFCASVFAQDYRATLTGQVSDASGAFVPNATIKATNLGTNSGAEAKTNESGSYTLPYLQPGNYNVEVMAEGFQSVKRENIILRVSDKQNLPITMQVGQTNQEITVVGQQEIIQTTNADRGMVFDPIKTQEYPLNDRQAYMIMAVTPGVIFSDEQFGA